MLLNVVTVIALFAGPALAVWLGQRLQQRAFVRAQQVNLFNSLMATRGAGLAPERVRALTLIDVVFHGKKAVLDKWSAYFDSLNNPGFNDQNGSFVRLAKFHDLLAQMAKSLGYGNIGAAELARSYYPQAQTTIDQAQGATMTEWLRVLQNSEHLGAPRQRGGGAGNGAAAPGAQLPG